MPYKDRLQANAHRREYNKTHKFKNSFYHAKDRLIKSIGGKCQVCGFSVIEALDIHHPYPINDRTIRRDGGLGAKNIRVGNAVVLCANCHRLVHRGLIPCPSVSIKQKPLC